MKLMLRIFWFLLMIAGSYLPAPTDHAVAGSFRMPVSPGRSFPQDANNHPGTNPDGQNDDQVILLVGIFAVTAVIALVCIASLWRIFHLAGRKGWLALIPFYNLWVLMQIAKMPAWSVILVIVPPAAGIWTVWLSFALAKEFGKPVFYGLGLLLLPYFFYPRLAFGSSRYRRLNGTGRIPYRMVG